MLPGYGANVTAATNSYLYVGHPRADGPGQIAQREVERIDYSQYGVLMLARIIHEDRASDT
jgi:hypothetical protein